MFTQKIKAMFGCRESSVLNKVDQANRATHPAGLKPDFWFLTKNALNSIKKEQK